MSYSILDYIGNTPLVELKRLSSAKGVRILAKLEYLNPGGSIKDRAALFMIEQGEKTGELTKDKIVVEATSGNTGIGLAMICSVKGYRLLLTMSESASEERKSILKARGADILLTPGHKGSDGAIEEVYRLARENPSRYFMTDQYNNEANWKAHYHTTAMEIWNQTKGEVDCVVASLGTSGTLMGLSRRLKELNPDIRIVGAEPFLGHGIQGLKNMKESYRPAIFDKKRLDANINVEDDEAFETARRLAREEGLFVGMSSGAAVAVALKEAEKMDKGTIVVILPDGGERYLSTSLFKVKDNINLNLYNTFTRSITRFEPSEQGKVSVYTCGPTVHKPLNPGQFRRFVAADLLCRYIEYKKLCVNHVVNITDLDDKTIQASSLTGELLSDFTGKYFKIFKDDLALLNIRPAQSYPLVSEHVDQMVKMAEILVENGNAYEKLSSIYFDISSFPGYGALSGIDLDKIKLGVTVDLDDYEKDNPRDFTLLKRIGLSDLKRGVCINTKWGNVRPSLHLQCAAITENCFGESFDIHTGSRELVFPHHENQLAISMAKNGVRPARYWMHCDTVHYDGSLGEENMDDLSLKTLVEMGWSPRVLRFWLLSAHYRKSLVLSQKTLKDSKNSLDKLDRCVSALLNVEDGVPCPDIDQLLYDLKQGFSNAMDDDFKISSVMANLFKSFKRLNLLMNEGALSGDDAEAVIKVLKEMDQVLKIFDFNFNTKPGLSSEIKEMIEKRDQARINQEWEKADKLRDELLALGVEIHDKKV